jgi:nitrogen fixation protein FixH
MTRHITGRQVLLLMAGFFGVVIAANAVFVYQAITTFRGEDARGAYLQGLDYNRTLAARAAQAHLGWRATIGATRSPAGTVRIEVMLRDAHGAPILQSLRMAGSLDHPSDAERDTPVEFKPAGGGRYIADASGVTRGHWNIIVETHASDGTPFRAQRQVLLP